MVLRERRVRSGWPRIRQHDRCADRKFVWELKQMKKHIHSITILIALIAVVQLWAQQERSPKHKAEDVHANEWSNQMTAMAKMHSAMSSVQHSGNSDIDFARLMLPHHQAAIDMAKIQLIYGKDPEMRRLAQEIITDQESEIELMQLWLKRHGTR